MVNRRESIYREVLIGAAVSGPMAALFAVVVVSTARGSTVPASG
jgi:hypothetical protein